MKIGSIGYNYLHDADFVMDRPNGVGCYLFLLIKEPSLFVINGEKFNVKPNSFIMFTPKARCMYRAAGKHYCDDWMYFELEEGDEDTLRTLEIPFDRIVHLGDNMTELSKIMHILAYEHYSGELLHEQIEQKYLEVLILRLARLIKAGASGQSEALAMKNYRFTQLRTQIYTMPESVPDIEGMAQMMNMSRSGFQHLYKKLFGTSVISDVINGRLSRAKRLLCSTDLTVREIAEQCGYSSEYNFMRQFKDRFGITPTGYRKTF